MTVEGEQLSLDDIEHRILRPIWRDPRVHYALNCAAVGCPNLQPGHSAAAISITPWTWPPCDYVNDPRGMRIEDGRLHVSSLYVWFVEDFGGDEAGVIRHLMAYAEPGRGDAAAKAGRYRRPQLRLAPERRWLAESPTARPPPYAAIALEPRRSPRRAREKRPRCAEPS